MAETLFAAEGATGQAAVATGKARAKAVRRSRLPLCQRPHRLIWVKGRDVYQRWIDGVMTEFFVQGGRAVGTFGLPAGVAAANATLAVTSEVGELALASVTAWTMKCGWKVGR